MTVSVRNLVVGAGTGLLISGTAAADIQKQQESTVIFQRNQVREQVQLLTGVEQAANREMQSLKNRIRFLEEQQIKMDNAVD